MRTTKISVLAIAFAIGCYCSLAHADSYSSLYDVLSAHRLQVHEELKISYGDVDDQLKPVAGRSDADKWLGLIIHTIVYNGADQRSYQAVYDVLSNNRKAAHDELKISYGDVDDQLKPVAGRSDADKWLGLIIHHIVYNGASLANAPTPTPPATSPTFPIVKSVGHDNMEFHVKISANGTVEATAKAGIKRQSGTYRHSYWFAVLDASDNTLWTSLNDGMTLTLGAANDSLGRPSYVGKEETKTFTVPVGVA